MKFYFISKSDYSKYEASKSADRGTTNKVSVTTKKPEEQTSEKQVTDRAVTTQFFRDRRELKRRIRQVVQRYLKRALIQR